MWWFLYFSLRILTFAICSSVTRPVLKRAGPSEKIPSHVFMNRATNISPNASCLSRCRLNGWHEGSVKCATKTVCGTCGARMTPIPSQRARVSSVGKTPSFSFSQVDMYVVYTRPA